MTAPTVALAPGECRYEVDEHERRITLHLVTVALEHPHAFGGTTEYGGETWSFKQLGRSLTERLNRSGMIVLTKTQREFMHSIFDVALRDPIPFAGSRGEWLRDQVCELRTRLPKRGAGTY